ncbi:zinc finger B-box domain-containing protein 1 isoform X2 [Perca fluviatilis]|uniref:zinc finger B-box domain-containing protein 1 isoform X2 n=1 Tax=Perca fluviatilis TaxID=8168 RepID=UPI00196505F7|nr:zinc finger B-box domain-containing protein 1 isoform X2 [Perca fluviatilis]
MNLNDFVVLPNNKAKSVKLNARNLQELHMETVTLAQESKEMEDKLQELKESMSKEKEERGHSGGFRWKSGQFGSLNSNALTNGSKKNKENLLQKLSAGKVKIRVLKDEPLTAPPQPPPPPPPDTISLRTTRKNRLRGTYCGQCEVKTAGLMCAECTEDYCIGCFTKFHQKGALKLHRMIPIQKDLQTHVSTRDVVSCFQKQINPSSYPSTFINPNPNPSPNSNAITRRGDQSPEKGTEAVAKPMQLHPYSSQVLAVDHRDEEKVEMIEEGQDERRFPTSLLRGEYNEEESARSFQEALKQWRVESDEAGEPTSEDAMWTPIRPVSVSAMATQADLAPDRGDEGRGREGGAGKVPVRVEFTENSLTYMDRLLLKKHRRTPIKTYRPSLAFGTDLKSLPNTNTGEKTASSLTAQEEDFRRYCASLFAVPVSRGRTEPQITSPEPCLVIEILDERDKDGNFVAQERPCNNRKVPSVQQVLSKLTLVPQVGLISSGASRVSYSSQLSSAQPSRQSRAPAQPKAAQKLHLSEPQTSQAEHSMKSSSSKSKPSACTIAEISRTSQTSIKTPTSTLQKPKCPPNVHKSKPDCGSLKLLSSPSLVNSQTEIPVSYPPDVSHLASTRPPIPEEHFSPSPSISFSLRSTFTVSPSSSTESTLLPSVYQSTSLQKGSDSSPLPEQPQSPQLFPEPISSLKPSQLPPSNLESPRQSKHSCCDTESLLSEKHLQLPLLPVSSSPKPPPKPLESSPPVKILSSLSLFNKSPPDANFSHGSTPKTEDSSICMASTPISGEHESTQDMQCISSLPSHFLDVIKYPPLAVKMEENEELSTDSSDEMSSDSLGLAPHEEDSSDEEAQMHGCFTGGRSREEEQGNPAISHTEDPFVPADADREKDLQTDEQEQLSEPSMVMHDQSSGSRSEQFCDLDGFPPLGLDINSGHSETPKHTHCDPLHTCQTSLQDSDPTGSEGYRPCSTLTTDTEEHLVFRVMDNHLKLTGSQFHSTRPSKRGEISANKLGTSGSGSSLSGKSTPTVSHRPKTNPSPLSSPISPPLSHFPSPPLSACLSRASGSKFGPEFRPFSRAAREIMEICSVDQTGCEDPDLDTDTTAHALHGLEQELRLMANETGKQASVFGTGNSGSQDQHGNHRFTQGRASEEQKDEEDAAAQRDRQSVLSLP